jgi:hypothetical protein
MWGSPEHLSDAETSPDSGMITLGGGTRQIVDRLISLVWMPSHHRALGARRGFARGSTSAGELPSVPRTASVCNETRRSDKTQSSIPGTEGPFVSR